MVTSLSICGLPSNTRFVGPIWAHNSNDISIGLAGFAQMTAECPYTLQWDTPFPLKIVHSRGGSGPLCNIRFHGSTQMVNPNGISIGSGVFAGLTSVTDRQTDWKQTTLLGLTVGRIYVRSTVMRPNNNNNNNNNNSNSNVVKVILLKTTSLPHSAHRWFSRIRHIAPNALLMLHMLPSDHLSLQAKWQIDQFGIFAQFTAECCWAWPSMSFPPKIYLRIGESGTSSNTWFLGT